MAETKTKEDTKEKGQKVDVPKNIKELFDVGAHYGNTRSRRHPSTEKFIFGTKNTISIFDLDKTRAALERAESFLAELGEKSKQVLLVATKREVQDIVLKAAGKLKMPSVTNRWVGGTLTNFKEIAKRVEHLEELREKKESGVLDKYTKHERLLIDREIDGLERKFGGRVAMKKLPAALIVVDPRHEDIAVEEAVQKNVPVIAIANTDCDISDIKYPIPANDANVKTVSYLIDRLVAAYQKGAGNEKKEVSSKKLGKDKKEEKQSE